MWMSEYDIAEMYRRSADPGKQVMILAELNAADREVIIEILKRAGVYKDVPPIKRTGRLPQVSDDVLRQFAARGYTMRETASILHIQYRGLNSRALNKGIEFAKEKKKSGKKKLQGVTQ